MSALKTCSNPVQWECLRKHLVALACSQGHDDDPLGDAFEEVLDLSARRMLLAVFTAARQLDEGAYYQRHSAFDDDDVAEQPQQVAIVRTALKNPEMVLDNILDQLLRDVPRYVEKPLARVAAGDFRWAGGVVDGMIGITTAVAAIRELCNGRGNATPQR